MTNNNDQHENWINQKINPAEIDKYLNSDGSDFIPDDEIYRDLKSEKNPDPKRIKDILDKSLSIQGLTPKESACLINVNDPDLLVAMQETALKIKKKVYDNRIVTFAPLYMGNYCVNNCAYCGFRTDNTGAKRRVLTQDEIKKEVEVLAGIIGHKRLIVVYGEHPSSDINYIVESIKNIYSVNVKTKKGYGNIRRVNVNASPFCIEDLKKLKKIGLGTYQVFQETYHHDNYHVVHPKNTIKGNYRWRLYSMHRAFEAGIDDVGLGALFGLYDWKFEVMGLVHHSIELESKFGVGPHTISFPRLEEALNTPLDKFAQYQVNDEDFKKIILTVRLSVPHTGMIITARENAQIRRDAINLGVTQTDASTRIGIGGYSKYTDAQDEEKQQFILGDTRSLDEVIREFASMGYITSFCTAGYRCGRTGANIMNKLRSGEEGRFCKLNAVLTCQEWLDDFASEETKKVAEPVILQEINEIQTKYPRLYKAFMKSYKNVRDGERDIYF